MEFGFWKHKNKKRPGSSAQGDRSIKEKQAKQILTLLNNLINT